MVRVEVIKTFYLGKFNELKNIKRKAIAVDGQLFVGDVFECTPVMAKYLLNETPNPKNEAFVKVIEVIPEKNVSHETEKKTTTRKTTRKTIAKK